MSEVFSTRYALRNGLMFVGQPAIAPVMKQAFTCKFQLWSKVVLAFYLSVIFVGLWQWWEGAKEKSMDVKRLYSPVGFYTESFFTASHCVIVPPSARFQGKVAMSQKPVFSCF